MGDPNEVAVAGSDLLKISSPPDRTRTSIKLTRELGDAEFDIDFTPYGFGPVDRSLVLRVDSATAIGGSGLAPRFADSLTGSNLLVKMSTGSVSAVRTGGRYAGTLELRASGEECVFVLTSAEESGK